MGVTIHFEGRLADSNAYDRVVAVAMETAERNAWPIEHISESEVTLNRVKDGEDCDYVGPVRGVALQPHENSEQIRLEFDLDFYVQEYVKTQFAPIEVHIQIIEFLRLVSGDFVDLSVEDEGEYWEASDPKVLQGHFDSVFRVMDDILAKDKDRCGPVRAPSGRIIDIA